MQIFLPLVTLLAVKELTVVMDVVVAEKETKHIAEVQCFSA